MARLLQAVSLYGPKIEYLSTSGLDDASENMSRRTGLNKSEAMMVFQEMGEVILDFNREGHPLKLPGVGTFTPYIDRDGTIVIRFRPEVTLKKGLNEDGFFRGNLKNAENTGLTNEEYKALWDADHPEDPLEI